MDNISFTSNIKPITLDKFSRGVQRFGRDVYADYPWTYPNSVKASHAYTDWISDCTMLGITDGEKVFMLHLDPKNKVNSNTYYLQQYMLNNINFRSKKLNALLVGSKPTRKSLELYHKIQTTLEKCHIPYSELKNGKGPINVAYSASRDRWYISGLKIDSLIKNGYSSRDVLANTFEKVKISEFDQII